MADHKIAITDDAGAADAAGAPAEAEVSTLQCTVTAEAGVFWNGKQYEKGETIELDEVSAGREAAAGDVELPKGYTPKSEGGEA